jgi:hypothetical protein
MPGSVSPPRGPRRRSPSPRRDRERDDRRDRPRDDDRRERDRPRDDDRRDRDRRDDRGGDRDRGHERRSDRDRDERPRPRESDTEINREADRGPSSGNRRTPSPPRRSKPKTKELSFYKKSSSSSMGSFSHRRDPLALDNIEESAKERMERRAMGEVPARFGGTREQGVRNTMSTIAPTGGGSATRGGGDPLDRMPAKGGADGDRMMAERVAAMGGGAPAGGAAAGPPSGIPTYVSFFSSPETNLKTVLTSRPRNSRMIEVIANDRMGRKGMSPLESSILPSFSLPVLMSHLV